jgi:hypothetical protein
MVNLQYYANERLEFPEEFRVNLSSAIVKKIAVKLLGHYKIHTHKEIRFSGGASSHCVTWKNTGKGYLNFSKKHTSIGVICHEIAHAIEMSKRGMSTHAKKHHIIMKRLIYYCKKNKYISNLINKESDVAFVVGGKERQGMSTMGLMIEEMMDAFIKNGK